MPEEKGSLQSGYAQKVRHAFKWSLIEGVLLNIVSVFTMVFLARLVAPKDFGILTPVYLITTLVSGFIDSGLSGAIIRFKDISNKAISSAFWFILFVAFVMGVLLTAGSGIVADFYGNDMLQMIMVVFAANLFLGSFAAVPKVLLVKEFKNKMVFQITAFSTFISSGITIWLAYIGMGVWAIIAQIVSQTIIQTIGFYLFCKWRPLFFFSFKELRQYLGYGYYFTVIGYINAAYKYAGVAILGRNLGFTSAGIYNQAERIQQTISDQIVGLIQRIAFPAFSGISDNPVALREAYFMGFKHIIFVVVPAMLGTLSIAEVLIPTVFGENWILGVPVLKILCIAGIFSTLEVYDMTVIKSVGAASVFFRLETIKRLLSLIVIVVAVQFGMIWLALVFTILIMIGFLVNAVYVNKLLNISFYERFLQCYRPVLAALLMNGTIYLILQLWQSNGLIVLITLLLSGVTVYGGVNLIINRVYLTSLLNLRHQNNPK